MEKKLIRKSVKIYKPEILVCPFCGSKMKYKYTVSNKVLQFSSGKVIRIKNLGYGCMKCNDGRTYFSQAANKLAFKGYTYSAKIVCMIAYYKSKHMGRETICDILSSKGVEISDRNVDILYNKFLETYESDYDKTIKEAYKKMIDEYKQIRISIDLITINEKIYVILYDFFTSLRLAIWQFNTLDDENLDKVLKKYISPDLPITVIASIRNINKFVPMLKKLAPKNCRFLAYAKF